MKKFLAAILAIVMLFALSVPVWADETSADDERKIVVEGDSVLDDTPALNTDITDSTYDVTHFDDRKNLQEEKLLEIEDAYQNMYKRVGDNSCFTTYWFETELPLPIDLIITVEDIDSYKSFSYQCWRDKDPEHPEYGKDWFEIEHEFDKDTISVEDEKSGKEKHTVTLTIEQNGPITILSEYGAALGGFKHTPSVDYSGFVGSVSIPPIPKKGDRSAESPTVITCDEGVTIVPYKDVSKELGLINDSQWEQFKEGYKQLDDQVPKGMATRYVFYLIEEEPGVVVIRMDDIIKDEQVKVKVFNGSWLEQYHKVEEPGKVSFEATTSGFFAIFTQIEE